MLFLGCIGKGATARVSKLQCSKTGRCYARKSYGHDDDDSLENEKAAVALLRTIAHPNIVTYYATYDRHILMELLPFTLRHVMDKTPAVVTIERQGKQLLQALAAIHEYGLAHLDVKPENLLMTSDHALKLADFGLARTKCTDDTVVTLWYRPPELMQGGLSSCKADVWSAGCVLYEMAMGEVLFAEAKEGPQLALILQALKTPNEHVPMINDMIAPLERRLSSAQCLAKHFESPNGEKRTKLTPTS